MPPPEVMPWCTSGMPSSVPSYGDAVVAHDRELETCAQRVTVQCGHGRGSRWSAPPVSTGARPGTPLRSARDGQPLGHVGTRAEGRAAPGQDHDAGVIVTGKAGEHPLELVGQRRAHRVPSLRPVQFQDRDSGVDVEGHERFGHGPSRSRDAGRGPSLSAPGVAGA